MIDSKKQKILERFQELESNFEQLKNLKTYQEMSEKKVEIEKEFQKLINESQFVNEVLWKEVRKNEENYI